MIETEMFMGHPRVFGQTKGELVRYFKKELDLTVDESKFKRCPITGRWYHLLKK